MLGSVGFKNAMSGETELGAMRGRWPNEDIQVEGCTNCALAPGWFTLSSDSLRWAGDSLRWGLAGFSVLRLLH